MKKNYERNDISPGYYSTNEFLKDLKKLSVNEELEPKPINRYYTQNTSIETEFSKNKNKSPHFFKSEMREKIRQKIKLLEPFPNNYVNEVMKSELRVLSKENAELKFCLNNLNKKFDKQIKDLKLQNLNKTKEINSTKDILKKNAAVIELLGSKIIGYEKIFKEIELKNSQKSVFDNTIKDKLLKAQKENEELKKEISDRDEIIKSFRDEIDSKKEVFDEIDNMKNDMEEYLKTMDKLYKEIEKKDEEINKLKKNKEIMITKHKQEIEDINKNKGINLDISNISSNEQLKNELAKSKEKQVNLTKELIETKKNFTESKNRI